MRSCKLKYLRYYICELLKLLNLLNCQILARLRPACALRCKIGLKDVAVLNEAVDQLMMMELMITPLLGAITPQLSAMPACS